MVGEGGKSCQEPGLGPDFSVVNLKPQLEKELAFHADNGSMISGLKL